MDNTIQVFINNITSYPTVIFTGLVMFVTLYWLVSLMGMVDMDTVEIGDVGGDMSGDISDLAGDASIGFFSGVLLKFGLYGVPLLIIVTLISIIGWVLSYLYTSFLHQHFASGVLHYIFGTGAFVLVLVTSMWLAGLIIAPIRKKFAPPPQKDYKSFIGKVATVRTFIVDNNHGEASLEDGGAGLIFKVRAIDDNTFSQHDKVVLLEYMANENVYRVVGADEYLG